MVSLLIRHHSVRICRAAGARAGARGRHNEAATGLAPWHRRESARWIESTRKPATRAAREECALATIAGQAE
jgi:hypothetical protein